MRKSDALILALLVSPGACCALGCGRPPAGPTGAAPPAVPAAVVVDLAAGPWDGTTVRVDGVIVEPSHLRDALRARRDADARTSRFVLRVDDRVVYGVAEKALIDLAMNKFDGGQIETRAGESYPHNFPYKVAGRVEAAAGGLGPSSIEANLTRENGQTSVELGGVTVTDLGDPLATLLVEQRAKGSSDSAVVVSPTADVPYADVARVYGASLEAGFEHVAFRTSR